jgi:hypothetical protein
MSKSTTDLLLGRFRANLAVAREMLVLAKAEPIVAGHAGQPRAHPGFAVAAKADEVATRLAVELRLCLPCSHRIGTSRTAP